MSDDIKKLVERLRATFFEVRDFSLHDVRDAANALEAMAVNRDLWRDKCVLMETERDQMLIDLEEYRRDVADLTAERDRLKAALEAKE